jgi:hypothetical protein
MSNTNAIASFTSPSSEELNEAVGITQFQSETNWFQTIGGILIQGGRVNGIASDATVVVPFNAGFPTQVLQVFVQPLGTSVLGWSIADPPNKNNFSIINAAFGPRDFYWWALGV